MQKIHYYIIFLFLSFCWQIQAADRTHFVVEESDFLVSSDIEWDSSKKIIEGELPVIRGQRFSYAGEIEGSKDGKMSDPEYVIIDHDFPAEVGMYEVRRDNGDPFQSKQGVYMACFNRSGKIVEVIHVQCGYGARMMAIPLTVPMIEKKQIQYIRFAIPAEGDYHRPFITNWGTYTIADPIKKQIYSQVFADGTIDVYYFKRDLNEQSDDARINAALNLAYWGKTVRIPDGFYSVSRPVTAFYLQNLELASNAVLCAADNFNGNEYNNAVLEYDSGAARVQAYHGADRYTMWIPYPGTTNGLFAVERHGIRGGCIDGRGLANCIWIDRARGMTVDEISLKSPRHFGLRVTGSQEMYVSRCTCINTVESKEVNIGFSFTTPDNMIHDCVAIDTNIGFSLQNYTVASSLHHWIGMIGGKYDGSVSFRINPEGCVLTGCYADTSETCYEIKEGDGACSLIGCLALTNPKMVTIKRVTGIKANGKVNVIGGSFNLKPSVGYEANVKFIDGVENVSVCNVAGLTDAF